MAKKLLKEAVVRRFQSLANISPINEMYSSYQEDKEEEEKQEDMHEAEEEMADAPMEMDAGADEEAEEMDMGAEAPMAMDDVELTDEEAQALIALGDKLSTAMGDAAEDVAMGDAAEDVAMDDAPMDAPEEEEEEMMEALAGINYVPSQNEIVNEVARRVARRLASARKAQKKMNEALGRK